MLDRKTARGVQPSQVRAATPVPAGTEPCKRQCPPTMPDRPSSGDFSSDPSPLCAGCSGRDRVTVQHDHNAAAAPRARRVCAEGQQLWPQVHGADRRARHLHLPAPRRRAGGVRAHRLCDGEGPASAADKPAGLAAVADGYATRLGASTSRLMSVLVWLGPARRVCTGHHGCAVADVASSIERSEYPAPVQTASSTRSSAARWAALRRQRSAWSRHPAFKR